MTSRFEHNDKNIATANPPGELSKLDRQSGIVNKIIPSLALFWKNLISKYLLNNKIE